VRVLETWSEQPHVVAVPQPRRLIPERWRLFTVCKSMTLALTAVVAGAILLQASPKAGSELPFKQIESGGFSRQRDPKVFVIRSASDYQAYNKTCGREMPTPSLDWRSSQLVAVHIGSAPSTGYGVFVKRIVRTGPSLVTIEAVEITPPPGTMQAMHVTYPFVVVKTPVFKGTATLKMLPRPIAPNLSPSRLSLSPLLKRNL